MIPFIIVSTSEETTQEFVKKFIADRKIFSRNIFNIQPEGKEISIAQIREIKKQVIFDFNETQLYIIQHFDKASFEAQNAFLKTLEEHNDHVQFFLLVKNYRGLLPTIISRSKIVDIRSNLEQKKNQGVRMNEFLADFDFKIFINYSISAKTNVDPIETLDQWISFFRSRLETDKGAASILKEILNVRHLLINNNVNPQLGIDHILLFIKNHYNLTR